MRVNLIFSSLLNRVNFGDIVKCSAVVLVFIFVLMTSPAQAKVVLDDNNQLSRVVGLYKRFCFENLFVNKDFKAKQLRHRVLEYCEQNNIKVTTNEYNNFVKRFIQYNFYSVKNLQAYLDSNYIQMSAFKADIKEKLIFSKYFDTRVAPNISSDIRKDEQFMNYLVHHSHRIDRDDLMTALKFKDFRSDIHKNLSASNTDNDLGFDDMLFFLTVDIAKKKSARQKMISKSLDQLAQIGS